MADIPDINIGVEKVVGEEVAKLLLAQIPAERLKEMSTSLLRKLSTDSSSWHQESNRFQKAIEESYYGLLRNEINQIMSTPEYVEWASQRAAAIIARIREETERKLIDNVSNAMAGLYVNPQGYINNIMDQYFMTVMNRRQS